MFSIAATEDLPQWRRFADQLGRFARLITFDPRGIGLSDPLNAQPDLDSWVSDAASVLDAAGSGCAAVIGTGFGGPVAIALAAGDPQRVSKLVLANSFAKITRCDGYPIGVAGADFAQLAARVTPDGEVGNDIDDIAPTLAGDQLMRRWWSRESSRGASPAHAAAIWSFIGFVDVREMALALDLPVLVLTAVENRFLPSRFGDWLASSIAGARSVNLPGGDHLLWATSSDRTMVEIEDFLAGTRSRASGTSALVAIVFTDIVESTAQNVVDGDHEWIRRLDRHNDLAEQQVRRFGGTTIKRTGDGVLATFPTPSLALAGARGIIDTAAGIGMAVRAAVHVAEVEMVDVDVLGLGVTIAARALDHAAPGQLVATSTVVESVAGSSVLFEPLGAHDFKGVPRPWNLFAVTIDSDRRT